MTSDLEKLSICDLKALRAFLAKKPTLTQIKAKIRAHHEIIAAPFYNKASKDRSRIIITALVELI